MGARGAHKKHTIGRAGIVSMHRNLASLSASQQGFLERPRFGRASTPH